MIKPLLSKITHSFSKEVWTFLLLTLISFIMIFKCVNLVPQVDNDFFFSSDDPQFQSEHEISALFVRNDTQLIVSASGPIHSPKYYAQIHQLTTALEKIDGVTSVKSLSNGPADLRDAQESPLWQRLIIADDEKSTNLVVLLDEARLKKIVKEVEHVIELASSEDFKLRISGLPYVIELISRYLLRDLRTFSLLAFLIFGIVIFFIFRSKSVVCGTMICCLNACLWTFMISDLIGVPIGLLTANLTTIICVLTLSHIIFLTFNWKNVSRTKNEDCVDDAVQMTSEASFWSMLTTLLGFLSLLFVPAKPLRELGLSGAVGTIIALMVAYGVYPAFLKLSQTHETDIETSQNARVYEWLEKHRNYIRVLLFFFCFLTIPGIFKINTDPSMLSFFSKNSKIYQGLEYIDKNGGSSPLIIVVKTNDGTLLNTTASYKKMWELQKALERHRAVGSVISLPVLMAQAKENPLAFFLFWDWLLEIMEKPQYGEIAKSFITEDRQYGLFLLRMNELNRVQKRLTIIEELEEIVRTKDFVPEITGGVYKLQGHLSKLVTKSLFSGLTKLLLVFIAIAWFASRSIKISFAMIGSLLLIPLSILGALGLYRVPLDVVSSPASNVAIAMGIDSMIHMIKAYRRKATSLGTTQNIFKAVRDEMWKPVLTSMVVVSTGFTIFIFSTFPPTQRFGGAIVFGTIIATLTALYIMPLIAGAQKINSKAE